MSGGRIEILNGRERRRRWSVEEKLRIVAESREPSASVRGVAARHDVYTDLLSTWRNLERRGRLVSASPTRFVPVHLIETAPPPVATSPQATAGLPRTGSRSPCPTAAVSVLAAMSA